jgi:hypothetical protein
VTSDIHFAEPAAILTGCAHREKTFVAAAIRDMTTAAPTRLILLEDNDSVRAATELFLTLEGAVLNTPDDA